MANATAVKAARTSSVGAIGLFRPQDRRATRGRAVVASAPLVVIASLAAKFRLGIVLATALLLAAISVALTAETRDLPGPFDDTYIVLVYAQHILHEGIAYFSEPNLRVEGFTSTLDLIVKLPIAALFDKKVMAASCAASCLWLAAVVILVWSRLRGYLNDARSHWFAAAGLAFVACNPLLAKTGMNSLETSLYVATGVAFLFAFADDKTKTWGLASLALLFALARPEATGAIAGLVVVRSLLRRRIEPRDVAALAAPGLVLVARRLYFGYWAPNTYYAKRSATLEFELRDGVQYLRDVAGDYRWETAIVLVVVLLLPFLLLRAVRSRSMPLPLVFAGTCVYGLFAAVYGGGDGYVALGRFVVLSALTANLCLVFVGLETLSSAAEGRATSARAVLIGLAALRVAILLWSMPKLSASIALYKERFEWLEWIHTCDAEVATKLDVAFPHARIGQTDFEKLKYHNDRLSVEDLSGLNDVAIAHRVVTGPVTWGKAWWDIALERDFDIIFFDYQFRSEQAPTAEDRTVLSLKRQNELFGWRDGSISPPNVFERYEPAGIPACGRHYNFLVRKGLRAQVPGVVVPP